MSVADLGLSASHPHIPRSWTSLLLAFFDKTLQTLAAAGRARFPTKAKGNGGKHGAFPTSIVADDEIDKGAKLDLQVSMTHEIFAGHRNDNTVIRRFILPSDFGPLLACELGSLFQKVSFVR